MEKEIFEKYLKERYFDQMDYYDRKSGFYQKRYKKYQWILIILSALTPIFAALQNSTLFGLFGDGAFKILGENLQIIVVITSAVVAILTTGLKTFQYQELWVSYRLTQELLKPELYYYQFNVEGYGDAGIDKESLFVKRIESILNKEHASWPVSKKLNDNGGKGEQVVVNASTITGGGGTAATTSSDAGAGATTTSSDAGAGAGAATTNSDAGAGAATTSSDSGAGAATTNSDAGAAATGGDAGAGAATTNSDAGAAATTNSDAGAAATGGDSGAGAATTNSDAGAAATGSDGTAANPTGGNDDAKPTT